MAGQHPEHDVAHPLGLMRWEATTFLHWPYEPATVAALLPAELEPDTFGGSAWVSITPFVMADVRPRGLPPIPVVSTFPETNVRTYVRHRGTGRDGLWFLSLDTTRAGALAARAAIGVPYAWSRMRVDRRGDEIIYVTRQRRVPRHPEVFSRIGVHVGAPIPGEDIDARDHWLTGRWRAFSQARGRVFCTPVHHEPWPLRRAATTILEFNLAPAVGLPPPAGEPLAHYAGRVNVRLGASRPVR